MLSRTAADLYWIGRYMERAEFKCRLIEATIRLSSLGDQADGDQAWRSALIVVGADADPADAARITEHVELHHPDVEIEIHEGGQPLYPFLVGVE